MVVPTATGPCGSQLEVTAEAGAYQTRHSLIESRATKTFYRCCINPLQMLCFYAIDSYICYVVRCAMEPSNLLSEVLEHLAAAGTLRLRVVLDFKLEDFQFMDPSDIGEDPRSPEATPNDSGNAEAAANSEYTSHGEPLYELDQNTRAPRIGSVNSAVLALLKQLPPSFTRNQFEAVIPKAMRYNPVTRTFGVRTKFPSIQRAQQAYFSEFKKRGWVVPRKPGQTS